jgi:transcriptional regulator with XRE-family HTH domain
MTDIRDIRTSLGLTQAELATRLGIHQTSVSRMEKGEWPLDARTELALAALVMQSAGAAPLTPAEQADAA